MPLSQTSYEKLKEFTQRPLIDYNTNLIIQIQIPSWTGKKCCLRMIMFSETYVPESCRFRVELKLFDFPSGLAGMHHFCYGLKMGGDGNLYLGIGNNNDDSHLCRFDTRNEVLTDLGSIGSTLPKNTFSQESHGKIHVGPHQVEGGVVYFATYFGQNAMPSVGRLFRFREGEGISDLGKLPLGQAAYFMHGDERRGRLYFATARDSYFLVYDIGTGTWMNKGRFSSKPPFSALSDEAGRLYLFGYAGHGLWTDGPPTITRYDPENDQLETSRCAPPTLWVGALTAGGVHAYTTSYKEAELFRWRLSDWPRYRARSLGRIDPAGRPVYSNNLALTGGGRMLILAGSTRYGSNRDCGRMHGLWALELASGRKHLLAELNGLLDRSLARDAAKYLLFWTNANTVDTDGKIYIGLHTKWPEDNPTARLLVVRILP